MKNGSGTQNTGKFLGQWISNIVMRPNLPKNEKEQGAKREEGEREREIKEWSSTASRKFVNKSSEEIWRYSVFLKQVTYLYIHNKLHKGCKFWYWNLRKIYIRGNRFRTYIKIHSSTTHPPILLRLYIYISYKTWKTTNPVR